MGFQLPSGAQRLTWVRARWEAQRRDKHLKSERLPPDARGRHCDGFAQPLGFIYCRSFRAKGDRLRVPRLRAEAELLSGLSRSCRSM